MIDNTRIVLCGISLAGGYPLTIAAEDHDIAAVVCMIPVMSPKVSLKKKKKTAALPYIILTSYDAILGFIGLKPFCIPMFVSRSHLNDFTDSVYYPGYTFDCSQIHGKRVVHHIAIKNILTGQSVVWVNLVPFRSLKKILAYEAISALPKVQCPILVIAAKNDPVVPYSMLKSMMEPYSNVEFFTYEGNHYNVTDKWVCDEMITEILKLLTGLFDKPASENSTCFDIESEKRIVEIK
jgi:pimeloyl-ACP methyl ester carboxylesterase